MSTYSPPDLPTEVKSDYPSDLPTSTGRASAGPSTGGLAWSSGTPMLRMEDAVVTTVVTKTTTTTTSFPPIALPRIPQPAGVSMPHHLSSERYPLADVRTPEDLRRFAVNIGGRRVIVQEDGTLAPEDETPVAQRGSGWTRTLLSNGNTASDPEQATLAQALNHANSKDMRKRPHQTCRNPTRTPRRHKIENPSPPSTAEASFRNTDSPPRKKVRALEDLNIPSDNRHALLSPLPSPDHETPPPVAHNEQLPGSPSLGSGYELAALFSLPSLVSHFENLPDKLQQQILMHLLRRSRMPTVQRLYSFASTALKRDFITHLPHEVAVQILKKVDTKSLSAAVRVCKKWKEMIDSERCVWRQRLIDDDLHYGLGVEEEEEALMERRAEVLEMHPQALRADTPSDDEDMESQSPRPQPNLKPHIPLKHVHRRRYTSRRNWLNVQPQHTSFPGHGTNVVTCLQFDRERIVSASDDNSINVYDTATGQLRRRLDGHDGGVWALEYKGDTLVSGSTDRTVRVWDLESLECAHVFYGHTSTVRCLQIVEPVLDKKTGEYQPPYPLIVTGSRDQSLRVWKLPQKGEPPLPPVYAEDGKVIATRPEDNPYHIHRLKGHTQAVRALAAYGRTCVSGSYDSTVKVWDIMTGKCRHTLTGHEAKVYSIVYDRYRNRCASGSMDNTVKVWDLDSGECLYTLTGHTSLVGLLGLSPNYIVSAAADSSLRVWDSNTHELKHVLSSQGGAITCFRHDETKVVSGSDGSLKLWDIRTGQYIRDLVIGISSIWQVAFHGNLLVAASGRNGSTVFDVFDFGPTDHLSGVDDENLDNYNQPPWDQADPTAQVDGLEEMQITSPTDYPLPSMLSPDALDNYLQNDATLGSSPNGRRSRRNAAAGSSSREEGARRSTRIAKFKSMSVRNGKARVDKGEHAPDSSSKSKRHKSHRKAKTGMGTEVGIVESPTPAASAQFLNVAGPSSASMSGLGRSGPGPSSRANILHALRGDQSFAPIFDEEREGEYEGESEEDEDDYDGEAYDAAMMDEDVKEEYL